MGAGDARRHHLRSSNGCSISARASAHELTSHLDPPDPLASEEVAHLLSSGEEERLLEEVVERVDAAGRDCDVLVVEGLVPNDKLVYSTRTNVRMASAIDARVLLVGVPKTPDAAGVAESRSTSISEGGPGISSAR